MRWRALGVALICLTLGLGLFRYVRGPVRGWLGDVLVVVFLVASSAAVGAPWRFLPSVHPGVVRVGVVAAIATGTECFQALDLVPRDAHWLLHLTVGSTFDPVDFTAYAVGLVVAAGLERVRWGT